MAQKPSIPQGTRDFTPDEMRKRNFIFDTLKSVFLLYGYQQIETPSMENLSTLLGKYGEEGDKLLFRILNSGDFISDYEEKEIDGLKKKWDSILLKVSNIKEFEESVDLLKESNERINSLITSYFTKEKLTKTKEYLKKNKEIDFKRYLNQHRYSNIVKNLLNYSENKIEVTKRISEKGLRYDLTVPFARFVVQYRDQITFPFKRYQMQPVWRADRPQKGRYREFYQCDVDVVGSDSLLNEVELIQIIDEGFKRLGIRTVIKLNNRKILSGIAEIIGEPDKITDITVAIDKLEKIGLEKVKAELREREVSESAITKLQPLFELKGDNAQKLLSLKDWISSSSVGLKGIEELQTVFDYIKLVNIETPVELDLTLARGLNYYTGAIFEVKALDVQIGSICGGGRYDNLTGIFGLPDVSGVGISFGADRIFDVLNQLNSFPADASQTTQILFINFGEKEERYCLPLVQDLRKKGIKAELFPGNAKMKKQMSYADAKKIPFVALIGEDEMHENLISVKNMRTGEQTKYTTEKLLELFANNE